MITQSRTLRRALGVGGALTLGAGLVAATAAGPATAGTTGQLSHLVNGSFNGASGWNESTARGGLKIVPGRTGTAARLTHTAGSRYQVILNDNRNTVSSTVAGASYTATAWVRASTSTAVTIRLQEWAGKTKRNDTAATYTIGSAWTQIGVNTLAVTSGSSLDLNVLAAALPAKASLDVDDVTFRVRKAAWADDFSGAALDPASWTALNRSTFGDGNAELACLTSRPQNLSVSGGTLALTARREASPMACGSGDTRFPEGRDYTSAFINGKRSFTYGRFAVRAKLPTRQGVSKGLWPAFWMRPVGGGTGELDILEALGSDAASKVEATRTHQTIHYDYRPTYAKQGTSVALPAGQSTADWHTYAVEWDPAQIQWFVDGRLTYTRTAATTPWLAGTFNKPMYLRINLAVGGRWPGSPTSSTVLPASYLIDRVSVHGPA